MPGVQTVAIALREVMMHVIGCKASNRLRRHPAVWLAPCAAVWVAALGMALPAAAVQPEDFSAGRGNRLGLTFSPAGDTAYWAEWDGEWGSSVSGQRTIFVSRRLGSRWSEPVAAPFTGQYSDDDPFVSPDGDWLYFSSDRPPAKGDTDIWRFSLNGDDVLERLDLNSPAAEYSPIVVASGALYFASAREGGIGQGDIYRAGVSENGFEVPIALGPAINSTTGEWNVWVAADESEMIFEASSRPDNVTASGDLYYSRNSRAGWSPAVPIKALNGAESDLMPRFDADGDVLFYTTVPDGVHALVRRIDWAPIRKSLSQSYAPLLMVANRSSHEVTFVDLATAEIVAHVESGAGPHLLSNTSDGRVAVTGYGEFPKPHADAVAARPPFVQQLNSRLTVVDTKAQAVLFDTAVDGCRKPHASWIVEERVYVTCEDEREIAVVSLDSGTVVRRHATGQDGSHVLRFHPGTRTLAVANTGSGSVTLIDVDEGRTDIVLADAGSEGLALVGAHFWVSNATAGSVSVVDPKTWRVVDHANGICSFPVALDGRRSSVVWIACFGSAELVGIDKQTLSVSRRIALAANPLHLIVHPDRELAYASLPRENAIAEIDLQSGQELRRIQVGIEPDGLQWAEVRE